ncbi:hypothetical protein J7643_11065 [bacterium]|nr:hypothetical protein [bacterium]
MAITKTTFRLSQRTLTGPEAIELTLMAMREVLPYCDIDCVQLDRQKFPINFARYPRAIWEQLLSKREWHSKLIYHLANSLAETDHAKRMTQQAEFARLVTATDTHVTVHGTILYESESTPVMLQERGLPMARAFGCELQVDAFTEYMKQTLRDGGHPEDENLQRELYQSMPLADAVERGSATLP